MPHFGTHWTPPTCSHNIIIIIITVTRNTTQTRSAVARRSIVASYAVVRRVVIIVTIIVGRTACRCVALFVRSQRQRHTTDANNNNNNDYVCAWKTRFLSAAFGSRRLSSSPRETWMNGRGGIYDIVRERAMTRCGVSSASDPIVRWNPSWNRNGKKKKNNRKNPIERYRRMCVCVCVYSTTDARSSWKNEKNIFFFLKTYAIIIAVDPRTGICCYHRQMYWRHVGTLVRFVREPRYVSAQNVPPPQIPSWRILVSGR